MLNTYMEPTQRNSHTRQAGALLQTEQGLDYAGDFNRLRAAFVEALDVKESSRETYSRSLKRFFDWMQENQILKPKRTDILNYKNDLREAGVSALTLSNYIGSVRRFFSWLGASGMYQDISKGITSKRGRMKFLKSPLTLDQVSRVLAGIQGDGIRELRNRAILLLMVTAGLRDVEVTRADCGDIDIQRDKSVLWVHGKGRESKDECVGLSQVAFDAVQAYLTARGKTKKREPLFTSLAQQNRGARLTTRSISGIVKAAFRAAGLDNRKLTAHSLRHTFAMFAMKKTGNNIFIVQRLMRHGSPSTTERYIGMIDEMAVIEAGWNDQVGQMLTAKDTEANKRGTHERL